MQQSVPDLPTVVHVFPGIAPKHVFDAASSSDRQPAIIACDAQDLHVFGNYTFHLPLGAIHIWTEAPTPANNEEGQEDERGRPDEAHDPASHAQEHRRFAAGMQRLDSPFG
ncbi:MAG: hypothetical protein R3C29_13195 [Dehalococcoidia bacterium]